MPQGYDGLPSLYGKTSNPITPNLGLSLAGMDPLVAENFWLIDVFAAGPFGSVIDINGNPVNNPNFNNTTPTAPVGNVNVTWQVNGSSISAYVPISSAVSVNGSSVSNPNFNHTTPAAPAGNTNVTWQVSGSNVSAYFPTVSPGGSPFDIQFNNGTGGFAGDDNLFWDPNALSLSASAVTTDILIDPNDTTRGIQIIYASITTGNFTNLNIPNAVCSPAVNTTSTAGQALVSFDVTTGTFTKAAFGQGTVTSFSAGNLSPLFTTSVATATTTPALSFALSNAGGGTVFGNNTTSSGAPAYTIAPVLGIPGTSTGTIALASSTASGKFTLTAPASASTPTLTLPTTSNVLAGQLAGDGTIFSASLVTASAAGTLTIPTPQNQNANIVFAGPTSGGAAAPTFRALVVADIPNSTITPIWNNLQNATGALTLANAGNATTFNQTSAVNWTWANTTAATSSVSQSSPILNIVGQYWTGAASAADTWQIQSVLTNGTNGASSLSFSHTGSSSVSNVAVFGATVKSTSGFLATGSGANAPSYASSANTNSGMQVSGAGMFFSSVGTYGFSIPSSTSAGFSSAGVLGWTSASGSNVPGIGTVDTTVSRQAAGTLQIGSSTGAANTGNLQLNTITSYGGTATVGQGVASEIILIDLTAQAAAITATNITASAPRTGMYRIVWSATITTAGTTSTLGGANGFQVLYTSPTDSVVKTTVPGNSITSAANTTGTALGGEIIVYAKTGTAIQYQYGYTSSGTAMQYELHIRLEAL